MPPYPDEAGRLAVVQAIIVETDSGAPVGAIHAPPDRLPRIEDDFRRGALRVQPAHHDPERPGIYVHERGPNTTTIEELLEEPCDVEAPRTCELGIGLTRTMELAQEAGVPPERVEEIIARPLPQGTDREQAVLQAEREILALIPADAPDAPPEAQVRQEAVNWCEAMFAETAGPAACDVPPIREAG